jgi:sugar phosphate isomerase/epimerase
MEASVPLTLEQVARAGYREVEFAGYFGVKPAQLRRWLDGAGLTAPSAQVPLQDGELGPIFDAGAELGHRYLVLASPSAEQRRSIEDFRGVAAFLNRAGEEARKRHLSIAYHNHDFEFTDIGGMVPYDVLLSETDPDLVSMEVDLYWMAKAGRDPLRYFGAHSGRFRLCHLKDIDSNGNVADVGSGRLDFAQILRQRRKAGLRHFFVEHDQPANPLQSIRTSYHYLSTLAV